MSAVLGYYRQLPDGVELRLHDTPLYNSIYRFDDEMLVNVHAYGILAAYTPVMHLRRVDGAFFNTYVESFERVWASARVPSVLAGGCLVSKKPRRRTDYWDDPHALQRRRAGSLRPAWSSAITGGRFCCCAARVRGCGPSRPAR